MYIRGFYGAKLKINLSKQDCISTYISGPQTLKAISESYGMLPEMVLISKKMPAATMRSCWPLLHGRFHVTSADQLWRPSIVARGPYVLTPLP